MNRDNVVSSIEAGAWVNTNLLQHEDHVRGAPEKPGQLMGRAVTFVGQLGRSTVHDIPLIVNFCPSFYRADSRRDCTHISETRRWANINP